MRRTNNNAYIALAIVSIFWGTTYLASRIGVRHMHGITLAGIRQLMAGVLLIGFFLLRGYRLPEKMVLSKLFVIGALMLCGGNGLLTWAVKYIPSGLAAIIAATIPIWITIASYFLVQRTRFSWQLIAGMIIGFAGVAGIFYNYLSSLFNPQFQFGILIAFGSCIFWSLGSILTAKWALNVNYLFGAGFQMLFSGVIMVGIASPGRHLCLYQPDCCGVFGMDDPARASDLVDGLLFAGDHRWSISCKQRDQQAESCNESINIKIF